MTFQKNQVFEAFPGGRMSPLLLTAEVDGKNYQRKAQPVNTFHFKYTKKRKRKEKWIQQQIKKWEVDAEKIIHLRFRSRF